MSRKLLGGALIALLAVYFIFKLTLPREFEWSQWDSMRSDDDNPLGCELFEEMAEATMENGYEVFDGDVEELFHKKEPFAILLMDHYFTAEGIFMTRIDSLVHSGCKLMIAAASFNVVGDDAKELWWLANTYIHSSFNEDMLRESLQGKQEFSVIEMGMGDSIKVPDVFLTYYFLATTNETSVTASFNGFEDDKPMTMPIAFKTKVGKGMVYQISCPLLMTNYGLFYHNIQKFQQSQMSQIADMHVVRVPQYKLHHVYSGDSDMQIGTSPLAYMLERPPLQWALYTIFAAIILFMFFTARRRQRVIPLVEKPRSRNIDFVKLLGTIYYRRHDNIDLAKKKYIYFREDMRRSMLIDIGDTTLDNENFRKLAQKTGLDEERISQTVRKLRELAESEEKVTDNELYDCIDQINEIIKHL